MDDKVYTPTVIPDAPFPQAQQQPQTTTTPSASGIYGNNEIADTPLPMRVIAHELISQVLNTKSLKILAEFQFTKSGAIQIGDFTEGQHGDIRISPDGITARNVNGETTFAIDGDTGDATFKGIVQAGSIITGAILSGDITLGGKNNKFGTLEIYNEFGQLAVQSQKDVFTINDTDGRPIFRVDFIDEIMKASSILVGGTLGVINNGAFIGAVEVKMDDDTGTVFLDADDGISVTHDRVITFYMENGGDPTTPSANSVALFIDSSGGKNVLKARFHTGASQIIATEP